MFKCCMVICISGIRMYALRINWPMGFWLFEKTNAHCFPSEPFNCHFNVPHLKMHSFRLIHDIHHVRLKCVCVCVHNYKTNWIKIWLFFVFKNYLILHVNIKSSCVKWLRTICGINHLTKNEEENSQKFNLRSTHFGFSRHLSNNTWFKAADLKIALPKMVASFNCIHFSIIIIF